MASNLYCHKHDEWNCLMRTEHGAANRRALYQSFRGSFNSDDSGSFPRYRRQLVGQRSGVPTDRSGARLMPPVPSHNHYEKTIYGLTER